MKSLAIYGLKVNLVCAAVLFAVLALSGCATTPGTSTSSNEALAQLAVQSATLIAVDRVVTRDHATPADIEACTSKGARRPTVSAEKIDKDKKKK